MNQLIKTAVVLAGGEGARLRPLTNDAPKPMLKVLGKPILLWVMEWLKSHGISNIVIGVAYKSEAVTGFFGDGSEFDCTITYSAHSVEGETGEGFRLAIERYVNDDLFVAMNGDEITDFDLGELVKHHCIYDPVATIAAANPRSPYGVLGTDASGLVLSFNEKPLIPSLLVSMGIYLFSRRIIDFLPDSGPIEKTTFPLLAERKLLRAYQIKGDWLTVNTIRDLTLVESILKRRIDERTWPT